MTPYHKYVFNDGGTFVGDFETMYSGEWLGGYDSWHQEDHRNLGRIISLGILGRYNWDTVLDVGCGKGAFTHLLKKNNNRVVGVDVSSEALRIASGKYADVNFQWADLNGNLDIPVLTRSYDLTVCMETLSYIKDWQQLLEKLFAVSSYVYLTLCLPKDKINGFISDFTVFREAVEKHGIIEDEVYLNKYNQLLLLSKVREPLDAPKRY